MSAYQRGNPSNIKVNDIQMYYEIHGEGEPLVLILGLGTISPNGVESYAGLQKNIRYWHLIIEVWVAQTNPI